MNKILSTLLALFFSATLMAQSDSLFITRMNKLSYITYKVLPKENFYSLGRKFNVHPRHLAQFNSLDFSKGLDIRQPINIPLSDSNFSFTKKWDLPLYYKLKPKEGLMAVSKNNFNVPLKNLRDWNKLKSDNILNKQSLIVGYIYCRPDTKEVQPTENTNIVNEDNNQPVEPTVVNNTPTPPITATIPENNTPTTDIKNQNLPATEAGYFKDYFYNQILAKPVSVYKMASAGALKSTSGWEDKKFYVQANDVAIGTIIRITNTQNNKSIYAKVLGGLNDIKQNIGLTLRITTSGIYELGLAEVEKFDVQISY